MYPNPPITPIPPALVTAAASLGPAATFMPASMIGWLILSKSVTVVRIFSFETLGLLVSSHGLLKGKWRISHVVKPLRR